MNNLLLEYKDILDIDVSDLVSLRKRFKSERLVNDWDCDFVGFLKSLLGSSSSDDSDDDDDGDDDDDDGGDDDDAADDEDHGQEDLHLKMFLKNIRPDGNSYVLKRNGKPDLKFEEMFEYDDGFSSCNEMEENVEDQEEWRNDFRNDSRRRHGKNLSSLRSDDMGKEKGTVEMRAKNVKNRKNVEKEKSFMENVRDSSTEEADLSSDCMRIWMNGKVERKAKNVKNRKNVKLEKSFMEFESDSSTEEVDLSSDCMRISRNVKENGKAERRAKNVKSRKNVEKEKSFMENVRDSSMEEVDLTGERLGKVARCPSSAADFDPDWMMFLNHCKMEGDLLVLDINGKILKYGEDDNKSLSDSEVLVLDHAPDCIEGHDPASNSKPLDAHMEEDDLICLGSHSTAENPRFRRAVMDILQKPFNHKEYKRLWHEVKLRKPTERHIDTRSGTKSFQQAIIGKSYLDHYDDLGRQLDAYKSDVQRRLNILRGFFFYLENMSDDGKFKPWLDVSCLAIIPRTG